VGRLDVVGVPDVWFREADQRAGAFGFEVLVSSDGMKAQYRKTRMSDDAMNVETFRGETSCQAAMRRFNEDVIKEVHG